MLTHFANSGMNVELADIINLQGTAKFNKKIRHGHKEWPEELSSVPISWRNEPFFYNDSELQYVNSMAHTVGLSIPFPDAEVLV